MSTHCPKIQTASATARRQIGPCYFGNTGPNTCTAVQVMEEKVTDVNVDIATVTPDGGFALFSKEQVSEVLARI